MARLRFSAKHRNSPNGLIMAASVQIKSTVRLVAMISRARGGSS